MNMVLALSICVLAVQSLAAVAKSQLKRSTDNTTGLEYKVPTVRQNCSLKPVAPNVIEHIVTAVSKNRLIKFDIRLVNRSDNLLDSSLGDLYSPSEWMLSVTDAGRSLLLLKEYFDSMSLQTLAYRIETIPFAVKQQPEGCLRNGGVSAEHVERIFREHVLNNFYEEDDALPDTVNLCNKHIANDDFRTGYIKYVCCHKTLHDNIVCHDLKANVWVSILFKIILALQILFVAFLPILLPKSLFTVKSEYLDYQHVPNEKEPLTIRVQRLDSEIRPDSLGLRTERVRIHPETHMKQFVKGISQIPENEQRDMPVKSVQLAVKVTKILPEGDVPVGLISFIANFFGQCHLRREVSSVTECCNTNIFPDVCSKFNMMWYQCLTHVTAVIMFLIVTLPWLVRISFYYLHERTDFEALTTTLAARNLTAFNTAGFTTSLGPTHPVFLCTYTLVLITFILYHFLPPRLQQKLKFSIRKCFVDTRNEKKLKTCSVFVSHILYPFKKCRILGCLVMPGWLFTFPPLILTWTIYILPISNFGMRIFINCVYYVTEFVHPARRFISAHKERFNNVGIIEFHKNWIQNAVVVDFKAKHLRSNPLFHLLALLLIVVTMLSVLLIVTECIAFYVECAIYIMIGLILNPDKTMKFLSLLILVGIYGIDCFSGVYWRYSEFSKTLCSEILNRVGDNVKEVAMKTEDQQKNTAFAVNEQVPQESDRKPQYFRFKKGMLGFLRWRASRLLLFLDSKDTPFITKRFLLSAAKLPYFACPGRIHILYLKALVDFCLILMFLSFVFIVVLAFGQANSLSSASQALAALAGGFVPLVIRKFLLKSHSGPTIDTGKLKWKALLDNYIQTFENSWIFSDIIPNVPLQNRKMSEIHDIEVYTITAKPEYNQPDTRSLPRIHEAGLADDQFEMGPTEDKGLMTQQGTGSPLIRGSCRRSEGPEGEINEAADTFSRLYNGDLDMVVQFDNANSKRRYIKIFIRDSCQHSEHVPITRGSILEDTSV